MTNVDSKPIQTPQQKAVTWALAAGFFSALALAFAGMVAHDLALQGLGIGLLTVMIVITNLWSKRRAAKDPAFAKRVEDARAKVRKSRKSDTRAHLIGGTIAVLAGVAALGVRRLMPGFEALAKSDQRFYLILAAVVVLVIGNLAWMAWKKRRAT